MYDTDILKAKMANDGYAIVDHVLSENVIDEVTSIIENTSNERTTFRKSKDLFAIRQFLKELPQLKEIIFTNKVKGLVHQVFGSGFFVVKSIYFDKPPASNWFVPCHQDLTISVKEKVSATGFGPWTIKQDQYAVQPPSPILEGNFTIRIHLDDTDEANGALNVISGSHKWGIVRPETIEGKEEKEVSCKVKRGGAMLMRPLLLHASGRTINNQRRRVIHIECSNQQLPKPLQWSEYMTIG
jgi:ectoine hydroxylase-related dioxygenase (phytanoyl-CoA dioxygenase family)